MVLMVLKNANAALAFILELRVLGIAFALVFALNCTLIYALGQ
jgi:hypothetical protein